MSSIALNPALALSADKPAVNPWLIAVTVTLATFMELLDTSIANVALPHIAGGLAAGSEESTWVLSSYLVANAVVLPLSAWLSRVFGRKNYYMACVALFTVSSLLCGMAPSLGWLIFFRVLQGIGGGGLAPCEQAILVDTFPAAQRASAFAVYSFAIVAAPAIGPTLGGWLTDTLNWRWVFLINIPIGILSLVLSSRLVQDPPAFTAERKRLRERGALRIDYVGILLIALGLGSLEVVLDKGQIEDWFGSPFITTFAIVAIAALIAAVVWELKRDDPVVDFTLLKDRNFAVSAVYYLVFGMVLFGSTVLIPQLLQSLAGYTATQAGEVLTPGALVIMAMIPVVVRLLKKFGPRPLIAFGLVVTAYSMWNLSRLDLTIDHATAVRARMLQGFGISFLFVPVSQLAYSYLPADKNNKASSLTNLFRNVGGSLGIALVTTMVARRTQAHQVRLVEHLTPGDPNYTAALENVTRTLTDHGASMAQAVQTAPARVYQTMQSQAAMLAYIDVFVLLGVLALLAAPLVLLAKPVRSAGGPAGAH
jgi:DHA2 family multidrug resistance protein